MRLTPTASHLRRFALASTLLIAASGLSACGLTGDLKRGKPIFGEPKTETAPATLPEADKNALPPLPARPSTESETAPDADDELLGAPGS